jgi:hypothetical protein
MLRTLDRWRHYIPFWWWLAYDAAVGIVIAVGVAPWSAAFWAGYTVLAVAVVIDLVEFAVKRPGAFKEEA